MASLAERGAPCVVARTSAPRPSSGSAHLEIRPRATMRSTRRETLGWLISMFAVTSRSRAVISVAARDGEQHVVLGLREVGVVEVAADLAEHLVLRAEQALPGVDGEAAVGHSAPDVRRHSATPRLAAWGLSRASVVRGRRHGGDRGCCRPGCARADRGLPVDSASTRRRARADVDDFSFESLDVEYTLGRAEDGTSTLRRRDVRRRVSRSTTRTAACGAASPIRTSARR